MADIIERSRAEMLSEARVSVRVRCDMPRGGDAREEEVIFL